MKTLLIGLTLSLVIPLMGKAQTEKGRWTIGTQLGNFTYQKQENGYSYFTGSVSPSVGYFVTDGLVVGTGIPLSLATTSYGLSYPNFYNLRQNSVSIGLAPFVRYYFGPAKLKPFIGIAYSYSRTTGNSKTDTAGGSESKTKGYTTAFTPTIGLAYFVTRNLGLTASLNYNVNHVEYNTVQTSPNTPGASMANYTSRLASLGIGFQIFLGK